MKKLLVILLFPVYGFTQTIPDTCFTTSEMIAISKMVDSLWIADSINNVLINQQVILINMHKQLAELDKQQLKYQTQQIELLNQNIDLYQRRQKQLQPKWYDSNGLWFGSGILTTLLTAFSLVFITK